MNWCCECGAVVYGPALGDHCSHLVFGCSTFASSASVMKRFITATITTLFLSNRHTA
jgi:hypothetical protein